MAFADDLLKDARHLASRGGKSPKQSTLRRAVSTGYYALFHLLIADFASNWRLTDQRVRLARMFEHRKMRVSVQFQDKNNPTLAELKAREVAVVFEELQDNRNTADYDVSRNWSRTDVIDTLILVEEAFETWRSIRNEKAAQDHLMTMFGAKR
jgi:uncharacterized protein (UPF0332 family)